LTFDLLKIYLFPTASNAKYYTILNIPIATECELTPNVVYFAEEKILLRNYAAVNVGVTTVSRVVLFKNYILDIFQDLLKKITFY